MQGRVYDPALGRFLTPDPMLGDPASSQAQNAYSYVANRPLDFIDPTGYDPCPQGFHCATGPGNEIDNTIHTAIGPSEAPEAAGNLAGVTSAAAAAFAQLQAMQVIAAHEHQMRVQSGRVLSDGTPIRSADGTPILPRRINALQGNRIESNWGMPIRGGVLGPDLRRRATPPPNADGLVTRKASAFAVRLACGSRCAEASAPTSASEASKAPKQLSDARIARNALSQALAARSLFQFLGKVGAVIDGGIDGLFDGLAPEPPRMSDQDRRFARAMKKAMALKRYEDAQNRVLDAMEKTNRLAGQVQQAHEDLTAPEPGMPLSTDALGGRIYLGALNEYESAQDALEAAMNEEEHALNLLLTLEDE